MITKEYIKELVCRYVDEHAKRDDIVTKWGEPLVGFADAQASYIQRLPELIGDTYELPQNVLEDASIIIAYYVPFTRELARTNRRDDGFASPEWARAYEETNAMFNSLNAYIISCLEERGYKGAVSRKATTFDQKKLMSDWSQRHLAYVAGLGTFGINNMLITKNGCCGRYSTVVTNLDVENDAPVEEEYCLYKQNGTCGVCMRNCPVKALTEARYDRGLCYSVLQKNAEIYTEFGSSYTDESGEMPNSKGTQVCGKCVTQSPCAFWKLG